MTRAAVLLAAAIAALPACEEVAPAARGFGSRQLTALRDPTFEFAGARGDLVLYWTGDAPANSRYWSVDVTTGAVREHQPTFPDVVAPQYTYPADPNARFHCSYTSNLAGAGSRLQIDDAQTGQQTTIDGVHYVYYDGGCPTDSDPTLKVWRYDSDGRLTLWTGRYDELQLVPLDLAVLRPILVFPPSDVTVNVVAGRPAQPDALGIYAIDLTSFAVTELVPPALQAGAWADGATPAGSLGSAGLSDLPDLEMLGDHFRYWRVMDDGNETMFVGPLTSGPARELALFHGFGAERERVHVAAADRMYPPQPPLPPVWQRVGIEASEILVWDDGRQRLITCPTALGSRMTGSASPDGTRLALFAAQDFDLAPGFRPTTGSLSLVDLTNAPGGAAPCNELAPADVSVAGFSPDGSALFWLLQPPYPATEAETELWVAAGDGSAHRRVGIGKIFGPPGEPRFVAGSQLELVIDGDLVWLDTHDDSFLTHAIAEQVSGAAIDHGRWLIAGYEASGQDGTARLGVIERDRADRGNKRLISPDVATYMSPDIFDSLRNILTPNRAADDPLRIVYLVRGRNPSSQDGLWVASLTKEDIP